MTARPLALDPAPTREELLAARAHGCTLVAWRARGCPTAPAERAEKRAKGARPWAPYRSRLEAEYAQRLEIERRCGLIAAWQYEPRRFTVGVRRTYRPDFRVVLRDPLRVEYRECKGSRRAKNARDSLTRLSAVALHWPHLRFVLVMRVRGEWQHTPIPRPRGAEER